MTDAEKGRAAAVAWLRRGASIYRKWGIHLSANALEDIAVEIAAGDHTKED